ncbi:methyl-accepting chemotaxis protein [Paenibacillus odorifer]|jgi:methyl-accepting chemotaxis protein|uniref:methyl-accepting chemotaxis protein n=1 Tax=Paenibacillus odorifer TaxID=189426 RepID=UPI0020BFE4EF|nr:methyl-accepting chemotaxis protein [Paenibacillus odorifer]
MALYRRLSLTFKFVMVVSLVIIVIFFFSLVANLANLRSVSISNGELQAEVAGKSYAETIQNRMIDIQSTGEALAEVLLEARERQTLDREDVVSTMKTMLEHRPEIFGMSILWEPNAFDQNDQANINKMPYDDGTGRFIPYVFRNQGAIKVEPLKNYDVEGAGDYYLLPKKEKKPVYIEPYSYETTGGAIEMISVMLPILDKTGAFLGTVGFDVSLTQLQEEAVNYKPLGGYVSLITGNGKYAANPNDPQSVLKEFGDTEDKTVLWKRVKNGEAKLGYTINSKGEDVLRTFVPIPMPGSDQVWYTQTAISKDVIMADYEQAKTEFFIIMIIGILILAVIVGLQLWLMVVKPLRLLSEKLQLMSQGDLTQTLQVRNDDEFGKMATHFNHMTHKLREMFGLVADLSMSVGATSEELTANAEQTGKAAEQIAVAIGRVAEGAQLQNDYAGDSSMAMSELNVGVQRIADSSSSVSASADEVTDQTKKGSAQLQMAVNQMSELKLSVDETSLAIERLGERSAQISGIIGLISNISKQTNLLALNAAIEASRVGEHGRGFAVVASEIRMLADQTKKAAEQVTALVEDVVQDTNQASQAMAVGNEKVILGVQSVSDSDLLFTSILTEMTQVTDQIQEVSAAAQQMTAGTEQISVTVKQLADLASEASSDSQSVAAASEEQLASMEEISASSESLSSMVQDLLDKLSYFKI